MTRTKRAIDDQYVAPAAFAHFVLRCSSLEKSIEWYQTVLGMEIVHRAPSLAFLTYDDEHHRLALAETPNKDKPPKGIAGLDHVAYTLPTLAALLGTYRRLKHSGIEPVWPINHGLTTSLYYSDPDGNRVEFQVENFPDKASLNEYIRSEKFAENPLGVEFDPDVLAARFENGDPLDELIKLGSAPAP